MPSGRDTNVDLVTKATLAASIATVFGVVILSVQFFGHIAYFSDILIFKNGPLPTESRLHATHHSPFVVSSRPWPRTRTPSPHVPSPKDENLNPPEVFEPPPANPKAPPENQPEQPPSYDLSDSVALENLSDPDASPEGLPLSYLQEQLRLRTKSDQSTLKHIRVSIAFVEPRGLRHEAFGTAVIGYVELGLPDIPGCIAKLGLPKEYLAGTVEAGVKSAVDEQLPSIGAWIIAASSTGTLKCPPSDTVGTL